jgi:hypothetical protein
MKAKGDLEGTLIEAVVAELEVLLGYVSAGNK